MPVFLLGPVAIPTFTKILICTFAAIAAGFTATKYVIKGIEDKKAKSPSEVFFGIKPGIYNTINEIHLTKKTSYYVVPRYFEPQSLIDETNMKNIEMCDFQSRRNIRLCIKIKNLDFQFTQEIIVLNKVRYKSQIYITLNATKQASLTPFVIKLIKKMIKLKLKHTKKARKFQITPVIQPKKALWFQPLRLYITGNQVHYRQHNNESFFTYYEREFHLGLPFIHKDTLVSFYGDTLNRTK